MSVRGTLGRMGRQKTISDDEVLRIAREVFRTQGHTATTREIAQTAGISEAVLYQRYGSKDELFFAAMRPQQPDIDRLFGPREPSQGAHPYLRTVVVRLGEHFAEVIPLALRMLMHPSFDPAALSRAQPGGPAPVQEALVERLEFFARREGMRLSRPAVTARLLVGLAHDWALRRAHGNSSEGVRALREMVDVVWEGLRPDPPGSAGEVP
jgi:AcrR family transcriptional regulator